MQSKSIFDFLPSISDEDIIKYIKSKIKYFQNTYKIRTNLGYISPTKYSLPYYGFITNNIKIRYNLDNDYYQIYKNNYIYEFIKYLQKNKIYNDNEAILYIANFLEEYLGRKVSRLKRREDILNKESESEIILSDIDILKQENVATSLEYSIIAQNLLIFLGYDSIFLIGACKLNVINDFYSFNIIMIDNNYYLFDFYNPIIVYNRLGEIETKQPYQVKINNEDIDLFLKGLKPLNLKDYKRIIHGKLYQQINNNNLRIYSLNEIFN